MAMSISCYDDLHDKYYAIISSKQGTRYERLAAFLFKKLYENEIVIHDLKMVGADTGVSHQIDVTVEHQDKKRRILIECKDFDVSGSKVGLEIVRNFYAVVDDTKPDEAFVLTTEGLTAPAAKYAKAKGIKFAIFRKFRESDWEGRVRKIDLDIHVLWPSPTPKVNIKVRDQRTIQKLSQQIREAGLKSGLRRGNPVYVIQKGYKRQPIHDFVDEQIAAHKVSVPGKYTLSVEFEDEELQIGKNEQMTVAGLQIEYELYQSDHVYEITSDKVAEMILRGFGDDDVVVFDEDLERYTIDEVSGEVVPWRKV